MSQLETKGWPLASPCQALGKVCVEWLPFDHAQLRKEGRLNCYQATITELEDGKQARKGARDWK